MLYSIPSRERTWNRNNTTQWHDAVVEEMQDPIAGSPATGESVAEIIDLFVDGLFRAGGIGMEQRVPAGLRKDFLVESENWNGVLFTRQRIRWMKDPQSGSCIEKISSVHLQRIQGTEAIWDR